MIVFPPEFVKIKHPGYFWNINDHRLYTIKVTGELRSLTCYKNLWKYENGRLVCYNKTPNYRISVNGRRRTILVTDLENIKQPIANELIDIKQ